MSVQSLDIISVNLWQILISLANLLIITFVLKRFLFKRVQAVLTARQEQVSKIYGEAEENRNAAVSMKQEYEARLASAREEADGLVRTAVVTAQRKGDQIRRRSVRSGQPTQAEGRRGNRHGAQADAYGRSERDFRSGRGHRLQSGRA